MRIIGSNKGSSAKQLPRQDIPYLEPLSVRGPEDYTQVALRDLLAQFSLPISGSKDTMVDRLIQHALSDENRRLKPSSSRAPSLKRLHAGDDDTNVSRDDGPDDHQPDFRRQRYQPRPSTVIRPLFGPEYEGPARKLAQDDQLWEESFFIVDENQENHDNFSHLALGSARDAQLHNVLLLYVHDKQALYLYEVTYKSSTRIEVQLITAASSSWPAAYQLNPSTPVAILMTDSLQRFQHLPATSGGSWTTAIAYESEAVNHNRLPFVEPVSQDRSLTTFLSSFDEAASSIPKSKTPRGKGLTEQAATIISKNPRKMLKTGMSNLYCALVASTDDAPWHAGKWLVQIQPCQLLDLVTAWDSLPFHVFASLEDEYLLHEALSRARSFQHDEDKPKSTNINSNIIGNDISKFQRSLLLYCQTLAYVFDFKDSIISALLEAVQRLTNFATLVDRGRHDPESGMIFTYLGWAFQRTLALAYTGVFGERSSELDFLNAISSIPDGINSPTSLLHRDLHEIQLHKRLPAYTRLQAPVASKSARTESSSKPASTKRNQQGKPPTASTHEQEKSTSGLCGFFHSTKGCRKPNGECSRLHRDPSTDDERAALTLFFSKSPRLTRKS